MLAEAETKFADASKALSAAEARSAVVDAKLAQLKKTFASASADMLANIETIAG